MRPRTVGPRVFRAFEVKTGAKHRQQHESKSPYGFRKWQAEAYAALVDAQYRRLLAPTGSGKSLTMKGLACTDMAAGARVILAYPMTDIEPGFSASMDIKIKGKVHRWEPVVASEATQKSDLVVAFLTDPTSRGSALICTHSTLRNAHQRIQEMLDTGELRKNPWRDCSVFLDEGHHSEFDEGEESAQTVRNRLHAFLEFYLSRSNGKLLTTTATWVRSTRSKILSPEIAERFTTYQLTLPRYLDEVAGIERLSFRFVIGEPSMCLKTIVSEDKERKTLTFLQVTGSRQAIPNGKHATIDPRKVLQYLLDPKNPKSAVYLALGYSRAYPSELLEDIRDFATRDGERVGGPHPRGTTYLVSGMLKGPNGRSAWIRTVWMIENDKDYPHFVTAYPEKRRP